MAPPRRGVVLEVKLQSIIVIFEYSTAAKNAPAVNDDLFRLKFED